MNEHLLEEIHIVKVWKDGKYRTWDVCSSLEEAKNSVRICSPYYSKVCTDVYNFYDRCIVAVLPLSRPTTIEIDDPTFKMSQDCQYGYHMNLTFAYGDGWFDVWTCDLCGEEAICTGELKNHGAEQMARAILKFLKSPHQNGGIGSETAQKCVEEIRSLHRRIEFLTKKTND